MRAHTCVSPQMHAHTRLHPKMLHPQMCAKGGWFPVSPEFYTLISMHAPYCFVGKGAFTAEGALAGAALNTSCIF
jgi:hypothetical protein